jgi:hypothetical protein
MKFTPFVFDLIKDKNLDQKYEIKNDEYYFTDGIFCSFNCVKSFIKENTHNTLYQYSEMLLIKLFNYIMSLENKNIDLNKAVIYPAPHWRLLQAYGGHLSINDFRKNFNKITFNYHGILKKELFSPIGNLYEEKINF